MDSAPNRPIGGNRFTRWLGRRILSLLGWRIEGELPNVKKLVAAAAPHTSNWDFILAMSCILALGVKMSYLMKSEAFFWPFKSLFLTLGGIPIDRKSKADNVEQIVSWYDKSDYLWLGITPEGTRSKVKSWKSGFLRIADQAKIPVLLIGWDYPNKVLTLDQLWMVTGDHDADLEKIQTYMVSKYRGRNAPLQ